MPRRSGSSSPSNASVRAFRAAADRYVDETFARFPTRASDAGLKEFSDKLEIPTPGLFAAHEKTLRRTLATLEDLPECDFGGNDWLDRRALLSEIRTELWSIERSVHRKNPEAWASG